MRSSLLKQQVNFYVSVCFIGVFGLFMSDKVIDALQTLNPGMHNPITESVQATQQAIQGN